MDNDPKHESRMVQNLIQDSSIQVLKWSAQSSGLNPIENLWAGVKRAVTEAKPTSQLELRKLVRTTWSTANTWSIRCHAHVDVDQY